MAVTTLTPLESSRAGVSLALTAANADGSWVPNDGRIMLLFKNGDAAPHTVTVRPTFRVPGATVAGAGVAIAAGAEAVLGPFQQQYYNDAQGRLFFSLEAVTSVTVQAVHVP